MTGTRRLRVAGYLRVSDPSQVETYSLGAQRAQIQRWCGRHGHELVRIYSEDGLTARSERIERRPQLVALLDDAQQGLFDIVVVHMIDRWSRNVGVQRQALQRLGDARVGFASVVEGFDFTTPSGKLMLTMLGGVSVCQWVRSHSVTPRTEPGAAPQVDPREAEAVREAFAQRAVGASTGEIAAWLSASGFRTRKGHVFTAHAVKDMLNTRFYCGVVTYQGQEFPGQHAAIIPENLYLQIQARRQRRQGRRQVHGVKGVLQGMISCARCGRALQSDRQIRGAPMYRERHYYECETNGHALMAYVIDDQVREIFEALVLPEDWRARMAQMAAARGEGEDVRALMEKRRRVARAYADGAFSEGEYVVRLNDIDARIRVAQPVSQPSVEEAAVLLADLLALWTEATNEERHRVIAPLIERVYIDVESRRIAAITPAPVFRSLLEGALEETGRSACVLLPAEVANQPDWWTWWRRGRIELPVQRNDVLSLLQAYPAVGSCRPGPCWPGRGRPVDESWATRIDVGVAAPQVFGTDPQPLGGGSRSASLPS